MGINLPVIWAVIIMFGLMMYVIMDGFDLGIGLLYPFFENEQERDVMMNSVAPVWDGNETWLILGGAGLLAAFPQAYAIILTGLYIPLTLMLIGLVFRGVAFEFRFKSRDHERHLWDKAFFYGSFVAAFFQGVTLGSYIQGIPVSGNTFSGSAMGWLTGFSMFTGVGLLVTYALLGSTWLIMKTEGRLQQHAFVLTRKIAIAMAICILAVCIWTPFAEPAIAARWLHFPGVILLALAPIMLVALTGTLLSALSERRQRLPFLCTLTLVLLGYLGLGLSVWPDVIPNALSIEQASAPPQSQGFALVGALFIIPVILAYTAWSYYVFRGKVDPNGGYH